jgi:hypothetical protein
LSHEIKNDGRLKRHDKVCGVPDYCARGLRYKDGASQRQAILWNVGTCRCDAKRKLRSRSPVSKKVSMHSTGADQLVVVMKVL